MALCLFLWPTYSILIRALFFLQDLKRCIIDEALLVLVNIVIIPHSGWDRNGPGGETVWSTVFRNSSGILRNVSSLGDYGRKKLRECEGLVDSLLYLVRRAIEKANIDNKSVENCVCVLRNLSYRAQEVEDPNYDKKQLPSGESRAGAKPNSDNLGCFGASKAKRKDGAPGSVGGGPSSGSNPTSSSRGPRTGPVKGMDLLWQPEVVMPYLNLLSNCSNPETLEAAAGAIQNLSACYWQPSIDVRAAVRKDKGLPILVELLRMEVDRVVCAVATALRNLAIDQRNKELIGNSFDLSLLEKKVFFLTMWYYPFQGNMQCETWCKSCPRGILNMIMALPTTQLQQSWQRSTRSSRSTQSFPGIHTTVAT